MQKWKVLEAIACLRRKDRRLKSSVIAGDLELSFHQEAGLGVARGRLIS